jgi:hypothetical protein
LPAAADELAGRVAEHRLEPAVGEGDRARGVGDHDTLVDALNDAFAELPQSLHLGGPSRLVAIEPHAHHGRRQLIGQNRKGPKILVGERLRRLRLRVQHSQDVPVDPEGNADLGTNPLCAGPREVARVSAYVVGDNNVPL